MKPWTSSKSRESHAPCIDVKHHSRSWSHTSLQHGPWIAGPRHFQYHYTAAFTCHTARFRWLVSPRCHPPHLTRIFPWIFQRKGRGGFFLWKEERSIVPLLQEHNRGYVAVERKKAPFCRTLQAKLGGRCQQHRANPRIFGELGTDQLPVKRTLQRHHGKKARQADLLRLRRRTCATLQIGQSLRSHPTTLWPLLPSWTLFWGNLAGVVRARVDEGSGRAWRQADDSTTSNKSIGIALSGSRTKSGKRPRGLGGSSKGVSAYLWVYIEFSREDLVYNILRIPLVFEMNTNIFENNEDAPIKGPLPEEYPPSVLEDFLNPLQVSIAVSYYLWKQQKVKL